MMREKVSIYMSNLRIGRHIVEAVKQLVRNKWMTVFSLFSVISTLLIVGVFTSIIMNINQITKGVESDVEVVVYIDLKAKEEDKQFLRDQIEAIKDVKEIDYVDKDEGLHNLMKDLGEKGKAFESLKRDNPLNDTYIVKLYSPKKVEEVAQKIANMDHVEKVDYGKDIVRKLLKTTEGIRNFGLVLIAGLVFTALLLIANTIKITIEGRSEEIKIMKLVGATDLFIRAPFVIEGVLLGVIGAFITLVIMYVGYSYVYEQYNKVVYLRFAELLPVWDVFSVLMLLLFSVSVVIGALGSFISMRKHLKI